MNRDTRQKRAIRDAFSAANRPLSTDEVLSAAQSRHARLGLATVYRSIKALLTDGWLVSVALPGEAPRYEVAGKAHHHHFRCLTCEKAYDLEGCVSDVRIALPPGFTATLHDLVVYGTCAECA